MKLDDTITPAGCIAYSPDGAALATGRSRTRIFKAIRNGELVARKDGRATLLEADELRRWVRSLPTMTELPRMGAEGVAS
jgi:hypothetical protein